MTDKFREDFVGRLGFEPDTFQVRAFDALDEGNSVVVAAPTGSGKTVVAHYAVAKAIAEQGKTFYTTPLKALSNQKFGELVDDYGPDRVGLLTGDNAINGEAPIVVMTTEVLRNMIYAESASLNGLRYVVLDEVHYLQNAYRGPVWEEVIIHAPHDVSLVCLSATVSNAEDLAEWIKTVRGATVPVIEEKRPVELEHLYLVDDRRSEGLLLFPTFVDDRPNADAAQMDSRGWRHPQARVRSRGRAGTPRRADVLDVLSVKDMLPAIYFIFSRAACDDAVRQCVDAGIRLTTPDERREITAIAEAKVSNLSDEDLDVLDYDRWLNGLEYGIAAHHAGMVPPFKEAVEACFERALVKAVFATETLALGINMPARSVVIEKLTKFTGERHEFLTPGEYTQLVGRAGRRGIDAIGYAVVLWSPFVPFDQVASLASTRTYALTSSFRPTYNMAVNLIRRYASDEAHHLLNLSFAQFHTDADVVRLERQLERQQETLGKARSEASCELGDVAEYRRLQQYANETAVRTRRSNREDTMAALDRLKPGDVLSVPGRKRPARVVVLSTSRRRGGDLRLRVLNADRRLLNLAPSDFDFPPTPLARMTLPTPYVPNSTSFQREVAKALSEVRVEDWPEDEESASADFKDERAAIVEVERHPVAACPDLRAHLRALSRMDRAAGEAKRLEKRIRGRSESLARQFDRVLRLLEAWGYVDEWSLTPSGERLAGIYHECDLLVAESIGHGVFDGLDAPAVAALASTFTYETRGVGVAPEPRFPSREARKRWGTILELSLELNSMEEEAAVAITRPPDPGFVDLAHSWAAGESLSDVLDAAELSGGDFVRNIKQLIDLLRQLGDIAPDPQTARAARQAADAVLRGVVAASSVIET